MKTEEIFETVVGIIREFVKEPERLANVGMKTAIIQDLKVNSARLVDIIIKAEDAFDIAIDDDYADAIKTVGDAVHVVERKLRVVS
ncbi:MAG: acyl carrier protein [Desulfobacterales bacterium CG23_combo_of_CG06-09_8_20_14_all_51_8]|nr:MAG: acyl carrier protein [Desulfobacterales bacterium CG23_combo_of_CG06-09_8_20_14_all_51_8]